MKVVFLEDVPGVAQGGDVKDVKNGFARNYLIPQQLATPATKDSLQRIERLKKQAEVTRLKSLADMRLVAEAIAGRRIDIEMRAGVSGRLYGSVTNAIVAEKLAEMTDHEIDRRVVQIPESIRETGTYAVQVRLHTEVTTDVTLLVHPLGVDPDDFIASLEAAAEEAEAEAEGEEAAEATEHAGSEEVPAEVPEEAAEEPSA